MLTKLEQLKELAQKATQGSWLDYRKLNIEEMNRAAKTHLNLSTCVCIPKSGKLNGVNDDAFIAAANPSVILELISYIENLENEVKFFPSLNEQRMLHDKVKALTEQLKILEEPDINEIIEARKKQFEELKK